MAGKWGGNAASVRMEVFCMKRMGKVFLGVYYSQNEGLHLMIHKVLIYLYSKTI